MPKIESDVEYFNRADRSVDDLLDSGSTFFDANKRAHFGVAYKATLWSSPHPSA